MYLPDSTLGKCKSKLQKPLILYHIRKFTCIFLIDYTNLPNLAVPNVDILCSYTTVLYIVQVGQTTVGTRT